MLIVEKSKDPSFYIQQPVYMHSLETSILKVLVYFDLFSYPLTGEEIRFFLDQPFREDKIVCSFEKLLHGGHIWQLGNFYSLHNDETLAARRIAGNAMAGALIKKAKRVATFLSWLPYVRGIAVSGSLSKNFADKNSDLDFFIITAANRLWIVRLMYAVVYKAASVLGLKSWFCLNYFIDELDMQIEEHNVFTAVEVATLMPLKGAGVFSEFFLANSWAAQFLPNHIANTKQLHDKRPILLKRLAEWLLNFEAGNRLDNKILAFYRQRFAVMKAENKLSEKGLVIGAYAADKHGCKPLAEYFQPKILARFNERFKNIKDKYAQDTKRSEQVLYK